MKRELLVAQIAIAFIACLCATPAAHAADPAKIRVDWATYNPVSIILKDQKIIEEEFKQDGIAIEWVQSVGGNRALEFIQNGAVDFASAAGSAAFVGRANGIPAKAIYVFSRPEWTALVVKQDSPMKTVADLKGKKVAVTLGTDPHIFLLRSLDGAGLAAADVTIVPLQHAEGGAALEKGEVDAWSGLDPIMARSELVSKSRLLFRDPYFNTYGVLVTREDYAAANPKIVERVLKAYEVGRNWALRNPDGLRAALAKAANIDDAVAARQIERTDLRNPQIGNAHQRTIQAAGEALQKAGAIPASVNVEKTVQDLIDRQFSSKLQVN